MQFDNIGGFVLVIDPDHRRFSEVARVLSCTDDGMYRVQFERGGPKETFPDGTHDGDMPPQVLFLRDRDTLEKVQHRLETSEVRKRMCELHATPRPSPELIAAEMEMLLYPAARTNP